MNKRQETLEEDIKDLKQKFKNAKELSYDIGVLVTKFEEVDHHMGAIWQEIIVVTNEIDNIKEKIENE